MSTEDRRIVAAILRLATIVTLHEIARLLAPAASREMALAWQSYYEAGCDAAAAADALETR